ncbi:proline iminopeptidase [Vagococcus salmoninarum]|uniref:Proline iminopeptidase n=1 Tax=Vagococcus salmoninarum TaxID=2739 RepID=A0A429ZM49_9ENTE|nr:proline iminopeptidase-family hydrolase [Vagococcus salmoninarum]MBE9389824.1 proline iminopeptidase-family hydrolase [Vagococcus salmoninarum]RST94739.1 alpha/beta hydrolase [Vagococcus salmoninarum]
MTITEGYLPYLGYHTYYRIIGDLSSPKIPLLLLHGGPGSSHNYFELLDSLAAEGRPLIMYDQLGCGLSATDSRPDLWHADTWLNELIALRQHLDLDKLHLLGQSWGGMMAIQYLCDYQPTGIQSVILSSTLPAAELWDQEQHRLIALMAESDQVAIAKAEASGDFSDPAYLAANDRFMTRHVGDLPTPQSPEPLRRPKASGRESYVTAWGPNEYNPLGTLKGWDYRSKLNSITVPALIISGADDLSTPLIAKTMDDLLPNSTWELFAKSRHMPFVDETANYLAVLEEWLTDKDNL